MSSPTTIRIETAHAALEFTVCDGVLRQSAFGPSPSGQQDFAVAYPAAGDGWTFEPALRVIHTDGNTSADMRVVGTSTADGITRISLKDPEYPFFLDLLFRPSFDDDVIEAWSEIRHQEDSTIELTHFASSSMSFGRDEMHLTQFRGDFNDEMHMDEEKLGHGVKNLDSKLGVRAHQFRSPWFLLAKSGPAEETSGEVWAGSLAWPGSFSFVFEKLPSGSLNAICGMNPFASEYHLEPDEVFETPRMVWAYSPSGTRVLSQNLHRWTRAHVIRDPERIRSVILNNWEATYFSFDEAKIIELCEGAKEIGVETFLLDDGWFGSKYPRDDDSQGLGDWTTDTRKLPGGIGALVSAAQGKNLRFGIWVEPEMVNTKSELFESHPEWAIQQPMRGLKLERNQLVLDLTRPEVQAFVFESVDRILRENPGITYVKWDCNRYVTQPGSLYLAADRQSHLWIKYVRVLNQIFSKVVAAHPHVEIMMCSGGGGRIDYGSMRFAQEFWPSDNTDPARRIFIQWGNSHFYPANAISAHVTHMGDRPLKFAFDVAMSGRLGLDMNLSLLSAEEKSFAARAIETYKGLRDVVQQGVLYRLESPYSGSRSSLMYVLGTRAVVFVYSLGDSEAGPLVLAGLDPGRSYLVREINRVDGSVVESVLSDASALWVPRLGEFESLVFEIEPL